MPLATFPDCQLAVQPLGVEVPVATTASFSDPPVSTNATVLTGEAESVALALSVCNPETDPGLEGLRRAVTGFGIVTLGVQLTRH